MKGDKIQTRLGILTLLSTWLAECPGAVAQFLKLPNSVAFLTAQVSSTPPSSFLLPPSSFLLSSVPFIQSRCPIRVPLVMLTYQVQLHREALKAK